MSLSPIRVPGKMILSGEYAVLVGGKAAVIPVDRWLRLGESESDGQSAPSLAMAAAMVTEIPEVTDSSPATDRYFPKVDRAEFYSAQGQKLGLGLSAAEAVATVRWRLERGGFPYRDYPTLVAQRALEAHRRAQNGTGSGADIYACALETPIVYWLSEGASRYEQTPDGHSCAIPLHAVYSGVPFDTRAAVNQFRKIVEYGNAKSRRMIAGLIQGADILSSLWWGRHTEELLEALDTFVKCVRVVTEKAGIEYWTPLHDELDRWARKHGGRAKPSGAGGDMILLVGDVPVSDLTERFDEVITLTAPAETRPVRH